MPIDVELNKPFIEVANTINESLTPEEDQAVTNAVVAEMRRVFDLRMGEGQSASIPDHVFDEMRRQSGLVVMAVVMAHAGV